MANRLSGVCATKLLIAIVLGMTLAACGSDSNDSADISPGNGAPVSASTVVQTDNGEVSGTETSAMREFLGIPYAAPPVGDLRFEPPQPAQARSGTLDATEFAPHCPQNDSPFGQPSTSEDCLYLNVFAPKDRQEHAVMVWIHGGALIDGESDDFNPTQLVNQGVIVVTVNYRLSTLGFLAHPALSAESPDGQSGDYGLMDQQAALRWVQDNIANFGGDPDRVTLFGQSAGGASVLSQIVSPTAKGLFQRAIVESGSYTLVPPLMDVTLSQAEQQGQAFASKVGCDGNGQTAAATAQCLRDVPVQTILDTQSNSPLRFVPSIHAKFMPRTIPQALDSGQFNQVPVIEGTNRNEWRLFVALEHDLTPAGPLKAENYQAAIQSTFLVPPAAAQAIANEYPLSDYASPDLALAAVGTDLVFACNGRTEIRKFAPQVTTYAYEFNDQNAPEIFLPTQPVTFPFAATHASEVQYIFDFFDPDKILASPSVLDADQTTLSNTMIGYWTQFAKTGDPNSSAGDVTFWPQYQNANDTYLSLVAPSPEAITDFADEHRCAFLSQLQSSSP